MHPAIACTGDRRYVPWFNAPPGTAQHPAFFYLFHAGRCATGARGRGALHPWDRYKRFRGRSRSRVTITSSTPKTFSMEQRQQQTKGVLRGLEAPVSVKTFKACGVDIAHLAEFHYEDGRD